MRVELGSVAMHPLTSHRFYQRALLGVMTDIDDTLITDGAITSDALAYLCTSPYDVRLAQERFPKIHFHPLREHAGLALQGA